MKDYIANYPDRKMRLFWFITDRYTVKPVQAFLCAPASDVWWVPEAGYSLSQKHHLFHTKKKAITKALADAESESKTLIKAIDALKRQIGKLDSGSPRCEQ